MRNLYHSDNVTGLNKIDCDAPFINHKLKLAQFNFSLVAFKISAPIGTYVFEHTVYPDGAQNEPDERDYC